MESRRTRPQIATVPVEHRWDLPLLVFALACGFLLGLGFGLKDLFLGGGVNRDESYLVLASTLYGQDPTAPAAAGLRDRLVSLGFANPSMTVLKLAESNRFAGSRDRQRQSEAEGLRIFGEALNGVVEPTAIARATPTAAVVAPPIVIAAPTVAVATPTPAPAPTRTPQPSVSPTVQATMTVAAVVPAVAGGTGLVRSADRQRVNLRKEPSSKSGVVAVIPYGEKVQVLRVVQGEAAEPGEARWYQIKWGKLSGYIYYKLVVGG